MIGRSLGGNTALALTSATLRFEQFKQFYLTNDYSASKYFLPALDSLNDDFYEKANQSHFDKRIDLAIALVPGFVEVMNYESKKIKDPNFNYWHIIR